MKKKLIRVTTVPISLKILLKGQMKYMSNFFDVKAVSSHGKELDEVKKQENVEVHPIDMSRKITPFQDFNSLMKMYKLFKKEKPIIVHTHTPKAGIIGMMAAYLANVPIKMHTVAGLPLMETKGLKRTVLIAVEKATYYFADKVYPNSKGLYDFLLKHKIAQASKLKVLGNGSSNGIDTSHYSPESFSDEEIQQLKIKWGLESDDFVFIFVGRLVKDKGINELVEAFKKINLENVKIKILLVGEFETELDPLLEGTLYEIQHNKNIIATGFQSDVRPYFLISDCLVFPSYREGFPNVVMQAGAMGLPAIVSDINGCNEIVVNGENGIIVSPKNVSDLIDAMIKVSNDYSFYHSMKQKSRNMIVSRYEQGIIWNEILKEYNIALGNV